MSVLIVGMEMPRGKPICVVIDAAGQARHYDLINDRYSDNELYEAVTVPPHGRLIEKSALFDKCYQHYEDFMWGKVDGKTALLNIEKEIKAAPTIIEAEGE